MGVLGRRLPLGPGPSGRGRGLTGFLRGPGPPEQPHRHEASAPLPSWVLWSRSPWASEAIPTDVLTWPREKPPQHPLSPCPKPQRTNRVTSRSGARTRPEPSVRPDAGTTCPSILPSPPPAVPEVQEGAVQEDAVALVGGLAVLPASLQRDATAS